MRRETKEAAPKAPSPVHLTAPYGFIDEYNRHRFWNAGEVIGDPHEIELLTKRGAPIVPA